MQYSLIFHYNNGCKNVPQYCDNAYKGADKFLARPGRKQATATEDFEFHT